MRKYIGFKAGRAAGWLAAFLLLLDCFSASHPPLWTVRELSVLPFPFLCTGFLKVARELYRSTESAHEALQEKPCTLSLN